MLATACLTQQFQGCLPDTPLKMHLQNPRRQENKKKKNNTVHRFQYFGPV